MKQTHSTDTEKKSTAHISTVLCPLAASLIAVAALVVHPPARAQSSPEICGKLENHYGPFDYRTQRDQLRVVEKFHFTPKVETLAGGESSYIGGDLNYTLRTSPNHHRALIATVRYAEQTKSAKPPNMDFTVECYLERAVRFRPDDTVTRALFAQYLGRLGRKEQAIAQLEAAVEIANDNPLSHHNLGLVYLEIGEFDKALLQAHRAQKLGFEKSRLENALRQQGKWKDATE